MCCTRDQTAILKISDLYKLQEQFLEHNRKQNEIRTILQHVLAIYSINGIYIFGSITPTHTHTHTADMTDRNKRMRHVRLPSVEFSTFYLFIGGSANRTII